jgi:hypothetical protein
MDSLKSLLDRRQYDLILSLTEGSADPEALVYRISSLLATGKGQEAMALITLHREKLFAFNPVLTLRTDFELRFINKQFDEAYEDLKYFSDKPYVSQEVEELLRALPGLIRTNERNQELAKRYAPGDIIRILRTSRDDYEVLSLLNYLQGSSINQYAAYLKEILVSERHPSVKTYALLLLVSTGYGEEVTFHKNGKVYHLVPKKLAPPYVGEAFNGFARYLEALATDPSVGSIALSLLNDYILDVYPEAVVTSAEDPLLATALIRLARSYLRSSLGIEGYLERYHLKAEEVEALSAKIEDTIKKAPTLRI